MILSLEEIFPKGVSFVHRETWNETLLLSCVSSITMRNCFIFGCMHLISIFEILNEYPVLLWEIYDAQELLWLDIWSSHRRQILNLKTWAGKLIKEINDEGTKEVNWKTCINELYQLFIPVDTLSSTARPDVWAQCMCWPAPRELAWPQTDVCIRGMRGSVCARAHLDCRLGQFRPISSDSWEYRKLLS